MSQTPNYGLLPILKLDQMEPKEKINTIKLHLSILAGIIAGLIPMPIQFEGWFGILFYIIFQVVVSLWLRKKYMPEATFWQVFKLTLVSTLLMYLFFWVVVWDYFYAVY